jgi:hypothetical protein
MNDNFSRRARIRRVNFAADADEFRKSDQGRADGSTHKDTFSIFCGTPPIHRSHPDRAPGRIPDGKFIGESRARGSFQSRTATA